MRSVRALLSVVIILCATQVLQCKTATTQLLTRPAVSAYNQLPVYFEPKMWEQLGNNYSQIPSKTSL